MGNTPAYPGADADPTGLLQTFRTLHLTHGAHGNLATNQAGSIAAKQAQFMRDIYPETSIAPYLRDLEEERMIGSHLARLGDGFHVIHSIGGTLPLRLDHLVICGSGIYAVDVISDESNVFVRDGMSFVNGAPTQHVANIGTLAAKVAEKLLEVTGKRIAVRPVLVTTGDTNMVDEGQTVVCHLDEFARWLSERPVLMGPAGPAWLYEQMSHDSFWGTPAGLEISEPVAVKKSKRAHR
jgi:hypothetical protein